MIAIGSLFAGLLLTIAGAVVTVWLLQQLWRRRTELTPGRKRLAAVAAGSAIVGAIATLLGLVKTFGAVGGESVDPSQRARIFAEDTSETTAYLVLGLAVWVPSVLGAWLLRPPRGRERP
jgi:hypothetical protein